MLRKPLLLCLLTLLCLGSLTACGEAPASAEETPTQTENVQDPEPSQSQEEAPSLTQLRADLQAGDYFCGIAFLGTLPEGDPARLPQLLQEKGYAEAYPFLADLPQAQIVTHEGSQVYCLVPRDQETSLTVQAYRSDAENGYQGEVGDTLYTDTQGQPVILIGNVSDVIPNLQVTLVGADGTELVYHPALGLCDNTIALPATPKVYDFSLYSTEETPVETDFLGRWTADGAELSFAEDGTMTYTPPDGAAMTGTFYVITTSSQYPAGSVLFELSAESNTPDFWGIFTLTEAGDTLTADNVTGDRLLDQQTTTFSAAG